MKDSVTYQAIIEEGEAMGEAKGEIKGMRRTIFRQGQVRFGVPGEAIRAALNAITDLDRLERMSERLLTASSWQELLDTP